MIVRVLGNIFVRILPSVLASDSGFPSDLKKMISYCLCNMYCGEFVWRECDPFIVFTCGCTVIKPQISVRLTNIGCVIEFVSTPHMRFITWVLAIHNIPEGLAVALVLVRKPGRKINFAGLCDWIHTQSSAKFIVFETDCINSIRKCVRPRQRRSRISAFQHFIFVLFLDHQTVRQKCFRNRNEIVSKVSKIRK